MGWRFLKHPTHEVVCDTGTHYDLAGLRGRLEGQRTMSANHSRPLPRTLHLAAWAARVLPNPLKLLLYELGPLSSLVRSVLNTAAPQDLMDVEVAGGPLAGARLQLDLRTEKFLWLGVYELEVNKAIASFLQPSVIVYDVGANIGYMTLMFAKHLSLSGQILAFEPEPGNFARLQRNIALNAHACSIEPIMLAVSDRVEKAAFVVHPTSSMGGKLEGNEPRIQPSERKVVVNTVDLDTFVYAQGSPPQT